MASRKSQSPVSPIAVCQEGKGRRRLHRSPWTEDERELIKALFPDYKAMGAALPARTHDAIKAQARKLGLTGVGAKPWTTTELSRLRRAYSTESWSSILAQLPNRNKESIKGQAKLLRLRRPNPELIVTPWPTLNSIRMRAKELGYTMMDLDALTGSSRYFARTAWKRRRPSAKRLASAIAALGGGFHVWWHESDQPVDDFGPIPIPPKRRSDKSD